MDDSSIFSVHAGNKSKTIKCGKSHKISLQRERGGGKFLGLNYIRFSPCCQQSSEKYTWGLPGAGLVRKFKAKYLLLEQNNFMT
jgi:hypothetical protein